MALKYTKRLRLMALEGRRRMHPDLKKGRNENRFIHAITLPGVNVLLQTRLWVSGCTEMPVDGRGEV